MLVKSIVFPLAAPLPTEASFLLQDFRLAVNNAIRAGLQARVTSRNALTKRAYKDFRAEHPGMCAQHLVSAFEVAGAVLKNYRRRVRAGKATSTPYVKRLMMKAENQAYKLDRENGIVHLPIRAGCHVKLELVVSDHHRKYLNDASLSLGSLTLRPDRVIIAFRKEAPRAYAPESALSLDTNERSMDGIFLNDSGSTPSVALFPEVAIIQERHHDRRKRLQKKKAHDRRTARRLCAREGRREHHRVEHRLHEVANAVLDFAESRRAAIVIEDLKGIRPKGNKGFNRRISSWPRRELHQILKYKSQWRGIPLIEVDPRNSSRKCPICGCVNTRMGTGTDFDCECGWHLNRHINAGINLLQTAASKGLEVAGGLRFIPGAFQHDVVMTLYGPEMAARSEPNGTSHGQVMA